MNEKRLIISNENDLNEEITVYSTANSIVIHLRNDFDEETITHFAMSKEDAKLLIIELQKVVKEL